LHLSLEYLNLASSFRVVFAGGKKRKISIGMGFRQTYKGIFQFRDQAALERAMAENQSEASGADAMGLQDSFRSEGVMLLNIDAIAGEQDWEEMAVAMATLAMHASRGFLYAVAFDGTQGKKSEVEYYEATNGRRKPNPANTEVAPALAEDYFPLVEGSTYHYAATGTKQSHYQYNVRKIEVNGLDYYFLENPETSGSYYNEALDSTYFCKDKSFLSTVIAGNERELHSVDPDNPRSFQLLYNNATRPGDVNYAIWKAGNHFSVFTTEQMTDVETPAGKFKDCIKIRVESYHVDEENMKAEVQYQYFAKGVGLVKYEKGEGCLELKSYHVEA
jgi:hypothetical protein